MAAQAIRISNLSKRYRLGSTSSVAGIVHSLLRGQAAREMWALKDVSLDVPQGEAIGILGHNGAGKSTLLKLLSRITEPTEGRIELRGRVASLLEVGTGFHPDLSGRENIYLNGAILGMGRREIKSKFDEIVDFCGVERFLDTPVKRYSSGMRVRLAFAVAAHLDPDILIVDEVLAVGDAEFQAKCMGKMQGLTRGSGRTVLFVSHNLQAVRGLCDRVAWLEQGRLREVGPVGAVTQRYQETTQPVATSPDLPRRIAALPHDPAFQLVSVDVRQYGTATTRIANGSPFEVHLGYRVKTPVYGLRLHVDLCDEHGDVLVRSFHDGHGPAPAATAPGLYTTTATFPADLLAPRRYTLVIHAGIHNVRDCLDGGLRVCLDARQTNRINLGYTGDTVHAKLQPRIVWTHRSTGKQDVVSDAA